jgi:parallel beta-helix repeat protein
LSTPLAAAQIYPHSDHMIIDQDESLSSLLQYQEFQHFSNPGKMMISKSNGICYLHQPLHISINSTFRFDGADCPELRLYPGTYIRIAGTAYFMNIKVTSADAQSKAPISLSRETHNQPRPHIYTDAPAEYVEIQNSEFSYLGSYTEEEGSAWGVSFWHLKSGYINNSKFHHNYFGIYTWDTKDLIIENSSFHDNLEYGMDFHDYSDNFIIKSNEVYHNGNHGIIFSKFCENNQIIDNHIYNNTLKAFVKGVTKTYGTHGIMLHQTSNHNLISGNVLENNDRAIYLYRSDHNTVKNNIILNDLRDGIYLDQSSNNEIFNNIGLATASYGLYSYHSNNNKYQDNYFEKGSYFKQEINGQEQSFAVKKMYLSEEVLNKINVQGPKLDDGRKIEAKDISVKVKTEEKVPQQHTNQSKDTPASTSKWMYFTDQFREALDYQNYEIFADYVEYSQQQAEPVIEISEDNVIEPENSFFQKISESFSETVAGLNPKMYHILAVSMLALMIFATEVVYKKWKK